MEKLREIAKKLDSSDKLSDFRKKFIIPNDLIYFDGNSLGPLSKNTADILNETIHNDWGKNLISSWNKKWINLPNEISTKISLILKCDDKEVYVGGSTSNNLYKILKSILDANNEIDTILTDSLNFPSDIYICQGISKDYNIEFKILNYKNKYIPDIHELESFIEKKKSIVVLSHVAYKSSYRYPIKRLNKFCEKNESIIVWDLSHSIGAIDIDIKQDQTKYAIGCTYKFLNGGPGSPAFIYVKKDEIKNLKSPIKGWFSHDKPFDFSSKYKESNSINKFSNGTPNIISMSTLKSSLNHTIEASTNYLETKSSNMFDYFYKFYLEELVNLKFKLITPLESQNRGSHIALTHSEAWRITKCLLKPEIKDAKKIIVDFRPPNIIRIALTPLYNSFQELYSLCIRIKSIVENEEFKNKDDSKKIVP